MRLTLETAKKKKPETRSRRLLQKEDEMSWGHEVCLVTWHMCPGSGDRGGTWAGNEVPDGENRSFPAVRPVSGRQRDETAGPWREGGVRNGRLWHLRAGSVIIWLFENGRLLFT